MDLTDADLSSEHTCEECDEPATYYCFYYSKGEGYAINPVYSCEKHHCNICEEIK